MEYHHGPLSNKWLLVSIFGLILNYPLWQVSESWGFTLLVFFLITFIASFVSAIRAPLMERHDEELVIHSHGKYPDTDLHHGLVHEEKVELHPIKRKVVLAEKSSSTKASKKSAKKTTTTKKTKVTKKVTKKTVKRKSRK